MLVQVYHMYYIQKTQRTYLFIHNFYTNFVKNSKSQLTMSSTTKLSFWDEILNETKGEKIIKVVFGYKSDIKHKSDLKYAFSKLCHITCDRERTIHKTAKGVLSQIDAFDFKAISNCQGIKVYTRFTKCKYTPEYVAIKKMNQAGKLRERLLIRNRTNAMIQDRVVRLF